MTAQEIAYYGRWFPYDNRHYPLWWYDLENDRMILADSLAPRMGVASPEQLDMDTCRELGFIPCFRVDIPKLESEFVAANFGKEEQALCSNLSTREFDYSFGDLIEKNQIVNEWRAFEYSVLLHAAKVWIQQNHLYKMMN